MPAQQGEAISDTIANVVANKTDYFLAPISLALAEIQARRLRALGVTTKKRSSLLPEVPTIAEAGVARFDYPIWYGVWAPASTPAAVVDKLATDIARAMATPGQREWAAKHGSDPMTMTQAEFARFVLMEMKARRVSSKPRASNLNRYEFPAFVWAEDKHHKENGSIRHALPE